MGSRSCPFSSRLKMTSGRPTQSSKSSRRMVSMRMAIWNSPRPLTMKLSFSSGSSILMATLMRASLSRRSRILRDWTFLPSRPARGEVLMVKRMATVGSSTRRRGSTRMFSLVQMVSPMATSSMPAMMTMSPGMASVMSTRRRPS